MPIKVNNFMGSFGWYMRKHFPLLASNAYLKLQFMKRGKTQRAYTEWFLNRSEVPMPNVVNIETVNRCNSTCAFCTANKNAEKRPFLKMEEDLYYSIIDQLADWGYKGHLTLYGNNEPWLDPRIVEFHEYARKKLPESRNSRRVKMMASWKKNFSPVKMRRLLRKRKTQAMSIPLKIQRLLMKLKTIRSLKKNHGLVVTGL